MRNYVIFVCLLVSVISVFAQPAGIDTVRNTTLAPYKRICFLKIERKNIFGRESSYTSTGFFIAPNVLLTAAHNIHTPKNSKVVSITIVPAKYYENKPFDSLCISGYENSKKSIRTHPRYKFANRSSKRIKYDFGVIIVPPPILNSNAKLTHDRLFVLDPSFDLKPGTKINVAGYPADPDYGFHGDFMTSEREPAAKSGSKHSITDSIPIVAIVDRQCG